MRLFVALPLPGAVTGALQDLQDALGQGRPVPAENMHLTLAFLDEQTPLVAEAVHEELEGIARAGFVLRLRGLGTFGAAAPTVVFAGVEPCEALTGLRDAVHRAARAAGVTLPRERFRPHVTLARFGKGRAGPMPDRLARFMEAHATFAPEPFAVTRFGLYRSHLARDGATHDLLADYPLG